MKTSPRAEVSGILLRAALARPIRKGRGSSSVGSATCAGGAGRTWGGAELRRGAATGTGGASAPDDGASSDDGTALLQVPSGAGAAGERASSSPSKLKAHGGSSSGPGRRVRGACALRMFAIALLATLLAGTVLAKVDPGAWAALGSALGMPSRGVAKVRLTAPGKASLRGASGEGGLRRAQREAAPALQQRAADAETVTEESMGRETTEEAAEADLLRAVAAGLPNHIVDGVDRAAGLQAGGHSSNNAQRRAET